MPYQLNGHTSSDGTTKYIGVDLFGYMLGFLQRNLETWSQETETTAYYAQVRPSLDKCTSVSNPRQSQLVQKLENIQRRSARYTSRDTTTQAA